LNGVPFSRRDALLPSGHGKIRLSLFIDDYFRNSAAFVKIAIANVSEARKAAAGDRADTGSSSAKRK
jgi:hypothetical protein